MSGRVSPDAWLRMFIGLLVLVMVFSLGSGRVDISFVQTLKILLSPVVPPGSDISDTWYSVIVDVRLPEFWQV